MKNEFIEDAFVFTVSWETKVFLALFEEKRVVVSKLDHELRIFKYFFHQQIVTNLWSP